MTLEDLIGEHVLTGVDSGILKADSSTYEYADATTFLFTLDGVTYRAIEDASDGYRSSMRDIDIVDGSAVANTFPAVRVLARMRTKSDYGATCDILELIDITTTKVILEVGTDNSDDYYPWFVGNFMPQHMASNQ